MRKPNGFLIEGADQSRCTGEVSSPMHEPLLRSHSKTRQGVSSHRQEKNQTMKKVIPSTPPTRQPKVRMTPLAQFLLELECNACGSISEYRAPKLHDPRGRHPHYCTNPECRHPQMEQDKYPSISTRKVSMPEPETKPKSKAKKDATLNEKS